MTRPSRWILLFNIADSRRRRQKEFEQEGAEDAETDRPAARIGSRLIFVCFEYFMHCFENTQRKKIHVARRRMNHEKHELHERQSKDLARLHPPRADGASDHRWGAYASPMVLWH